MDVEQRRKWLWFLGVVVLLAAVALAGWKYGLPAYRRHKELRSLAQGQEFLQAGDYRSANLALRRALAINSKNVEAARLMAELTGAAQSPEALAWWRRVVELEPSPVHKLRYAAAALRIEKRPFPIASQVLQELAPTSVSNISFHLTAAELDLKMGRLSNAESDYQAAVQLDPTNRVYQLNLATLRLLQSPDTNVADVARREIASLASDTNLGPWALRSLTLEALQRGVLTEAETYSQRLLTLPQATFPDLLQHLTVLKKANSPGLAASLDQAREAAATNVARVAEMVVWFAANDLSRDALTWLGTLSRTVQETYPVPLLEAECYLSLKDWTGLESRLVAQRWNADQEFLRLALLTRALREQGRRDMAEVNWRRVMGAANARVGTLSALFQLTSAWNWGEEEEEVLWAVVRHSPREEWAWRSLKQLRTAAGDLEGVYRIATAKLEKYPDADATNDIACVDLLLNRNLLKATELARQCYEASRTNAFFASTYALALYRQGKVKEGLQVMQSVPPTSLKQPDIALYYAVLLSADGQRDQAAPFIAIAEKGRMLPEEKQLLAAAKGN